MKVNYEIDTARCGSLLKCHIPLKKIPVTISQMKILCLGQFLINIRGQTWTWKNFYFSGCEIQNACVYTYSMISDTTWYHVDAICWWQSLLVPLGANRFHPWHLLLFAIWSYCCVLLRNWSFERRCTSVLVKHITCDFLSSCIVVLSTTYSQNLQVREFSSLRKPAKLTYPVFPLTISIAIAVY